MTSGIQGSITSGSGSTYVGHFLLFLVKCPACTSSNQSIHQLGSPVLFFSFLFFSFLFFSFLFFSFLFFSFLFFSFLFFSFLFFSSLASLQTSHLQSSMAAYGRFLTGITAARHHCLRGHQILLNQVYTGPLHPKDCMVTPLHVLCQCQVGVWHKWCLVRLASFGHHGRVMLSTLWRLSLHS